MSLSRVSSVARGPKPELVMVIEPGSTAAIAGGSEPLFERGLDAHAAVAQADEGALRHLEQQLGGEGEAFLHRSAPRCRSVPASAPAP